MKFLVDANLPFKLALKLRDQGFDVLHTDHLPEKELTSDKELRKISVEQDRIVISKDSDFLDSQLINGIPSKFFYISTGNIINRDLIRLIDQNLGRIVELFLDYDLIELDNEQVILHEK